MRKGSSGHITHPYPVLPFLFFFVDFPSFFLLRGFPFFFCLPPFFSRDFRASVGIKDPYLFCLRFSLRLPKNKERKDRVTQARNSLAILSLQAWCEKEKVSLLGLEKALSVIWAQRAKPKERLRRQASQINIPLEQTGVKGRQKISRVRSFWLLLGLVAQCSATPASVAATPPCSATPFRGSLTCDTPGSSRATGATGWGCSAILLLHLKNPTILRKSAADTCGSDTCSATGGPRTHVQLRFAEVHVLLGSLVPCALQMVNPSSASRGFYFRGDKSTLKWTFFCFAPEEALYNCGIQSFTTRSKPLKFKVVKSPFCVFFTRRFAPRQVTDM